MTCVTCSILLESTVKKDVTYRVTSVMLSFVSYSVSKHLKIL